MIDIGMDFGSTYTTVSVFNRETNELRALTLSQNSPYIPSVVSKAKNQYEFGRAAKSQTGKKGVSLFKAFKMMLPEQDKKKLAERGFDDENTPEKIASVFIEDVLKKVLDRTHEDKIHTIFVGAPEIWNDDFSTLDGRTAISSICKKLDFVENVQVVSEPAAASAFFAYNFRQMTKKNFEGNILLVDYGGGTLDITLTNVAADDGDSVEIKVLERTGAGENEEGKVGKAGIVYMETVMAEAIRRADIDGVGENVVYDGKFYKAVDELEEALQDRTEAISSTFEVNGIDVEDLEMMDEEDREFTTIEYKGEDVEVTYDLLVDVYDKVIRKVFNDKLDEMIAYMDKNGIRYMDGSKDNFKIALVGGFGNFYLVQKQIEDKFKFSTYDKRREDIIQQKEDCETAISLGAALLASNVIKIRNTAGYSIGVLSYDQNRNVCLNYAIKYKQDIKFGDVYFACGNVDKEPKVILATSGGFEKFLVNFGPDDKTACIALAKKEFAEKLANVVTNQFHMAVVGFSISASGIVTLHIHDYDWIANKMDSKDHPVELTKFSDLFEVTNVERIF